MHITQLNAQISGGVVTLAKQCSFCIYHDRESLERAALNKEITQQEIADILGVNRSNVSRHMREHVKKAVAEAIFHDKELEDGLNVTKQLIEINQAAREILSEARKKKDNYLALSAIARVEKQLELQAKLLGDIATGVNIIIQSPQFIEFKALVLGILEGYPDVKAQVVESLREHLHGSTD